MKIKEKVTINPRLYRVAVGNSTLKVDFSYSGTILDHEPGNPANHYDNTFRIVNSFSCRIDQSMDVAGGSGSLSVNALGGGYDISVGLHFQGSGTATFNMYLDDILVNHVDYPLGCPDPVCTSILLPQVLLYSDFTFTDSPAAILPNGESTLHLQSSVELCLGTVFVPSRDSIALTIISGSQYGSLRAPDGSLASSVQVTANEVADVQFVANCTQPPSGPVSVTVKATVRNITKQVTLELDPTPPLDHLEVRAEHSPWETQASVENGGVVPLFVTERDSNGNEVICDENRPITLSMDSSQYGKFIKPTGDTVFSPLTLPYKDIRDGQVKFTTTAAIPDSTIQIHIIAATSGFP